MSAALARLVPLVGVVAACAALGVNRAGFYRDRAPAAPRTVRPVPARALTKQENAAVLAVLDSDRFADKAPREVYAELLDEDSYLCSIRTMYRILSRHGQVRDRRDQCRHPAHVKPELVARAPNQVWSWDITKLCGPHPGVYYCLYVAMDIFSRYVVAWTLARTEAADIAKAFLSDAFRRHDIKPGQLACHSDRGVPMTATSTALLYSKLGITPSYSRPRVSDDNPYSEALFKTMKYRPEVPERLGSIEDGRAIFTALFDWYNDRHYHTGIALLTPADVHFGRTSQIIAARQRTLDAAFQRHPERFARSPVHPLPAEASWINPPAVALT